MKTLHLVCNAHLDPVWMWDWDEGAAEALATFYSAAELLGEYDYVFCHNEAILYEYVEKYDPVLFHRIRELVAAGKWHIMGGWYLQPDCCLPCGESLIRQIALGREYFAEKFPQAPEPTVAVNFDSFGHSRGLVQILAKCGYTGYVLCRPMPGILPFETPFFLWRGYDGSEISAFRVNDNKMYCTMLGRAVEDIHCKESVFDGEEVGMALWGVGNHGGGASRKDLEEIRSLVERRKGETRILHSTPEAYFAEASPRGEVETPLPCFVKCYTSIRRLKSKHAELENRLYETEKLCAAAELSGVYDYALQTFRDAERALCFMEFHDILSGTCTERGAQSAIARAECAITLLREEFMKAFHALSGRYGRARPEENPFILCNFQPYAWETVTETEILIPTAVISDTECYEVEVFQNGKKVPSQVIKEESNINYDRRKRIVYRCALNPLGVSRVDLFYKKEFKAPRPIEEPGDIVYRDGYKSLRIGRKSGLLESYCVGGRELLSGHAFVPVLFDDNADPWGWGVSRLGDRYREFVASEFSDGVFEGLSGVTVTERGEVLTQVECLFRCDRSDLRIVYKIYRDLPYTDVIAEVLWNERSRGLKLKLPVVGAEEYFGQTAYGVEYYAPEDGMENVVQRFVGVPLGGDEAFVVYNDWGATGVSMEKGAVYMTLLNGSAYCAHPINDRPLVDDSRPVDFIEQGRHRFRFRFGVNPKQECERLAQEFNHPPYSVNLYPHGDGAPVKSAIEIDDECVVLSAVRRLKAGGYALRLFNGTDGTRRVCVRIAGKPFDAELGARTFETYLYRDGELKKQNRSDLF